MIQLESHAAGFILGVKAQPGGRRNAVCGEHNGLLKVSVTQAPEKGKANKAIIDVLCAALDLRKSQVELLSGETNAQKKFLIRDIELVELNERIQRVLDGGK